MTIGELFINAVTYVVLTADAGITAISTGNLGDMPIAFVIVGTVVAVPIVGVVFALFADMIEEANK